MLAIDGVHRLGASFAAELLEVMMPGEVSIMSSSRELGTWLFGKRGGGSPPRPTGWSARPRIYLWSIISAG
jgi:hypothetical protein